MTTVKKILVNLYAVSVWGVVTAVIWVFSPLLIAVISGIGAGSIGRAVRQLIRFYGWLLVRLVAPFVPVEVENRAGSLPLPVVFVANHCSAIDPYLFGLVACENAFVTSWPFQIPVHNLVMRLAEYVDARDGWDGIERQGRRLLAKGCSVTIWPEGHRSRDGSLQRFRKGAFKLAVAAGRPVVPVCIIGSGEVLPPGQRFFSPGRIRLIVLPPVPLPDEEDTEARVGLLMEEACRRIAAELSRHPEGPRAPTP